MVTGAGWAVCPVLTQVTGGPLHATQIRISMTCSGSVQQVVCQAVVWGLCGCNGLILLGYFGSVVPWYLKGDCWCSC